MHAPCLSRSSDLSSADSVSDTRLLHTASKHAFVFGHVYFKSLPVWSVWLAHELAPRHSSFQEHAADGQCTEALAGVSTGQA